MSLVRILEEQHLSGRCRLFWASETDDFSCDYNEETPPSLFLVVTLLEESLRRVIIRSSVWPGGIT